MLIMFRTSRLPACLARLVQTPVVVTKLDRIAGRPLQVAEQWFISNCAEVVEQPMLRRPAKRHHVIGEILLVPLEDGRQDHGGAVVIDLHIPAVVHEFKRSWKKKPIPLTMASKVQRTAANLSIASGYPIPRKEETTSEYLRRSEDDKAGRIG